MVEVEVVVRKARTEVAKGVSWMRRDVWGLRGSGRERMIGLVGGGVVVVSEAVGGAMVEGLWLAWEVNDMVSWRREYCDTLCADENVFDLK